MTLSRSRSRSTLICGRRRDFLIIRSIKINMESKRKVSNWSNLMVNTLISSCEKHREILEGKFSPTVTIRKKQETWDLVTASINRYFFLRENYLFHLPLWVSCYFPDCYFNVIPALVFFVAVPVDNLCT